MRGRTFATLYTVDPAVPAALADHLAAVGRLLGLGHRRRCSTDQSVVDRAVHATRSPACGSRSGAAGSSRSSPGSWRGGRSAGGAAGGGECRGAADARGAVEPIRPLGWSSRRRSPSRSTPTTTRTRRASGARRDRGRFVVLEGGDGSGKSTQVARLARWLRARGVDVCETFEPGATAAGAVIRELLLHGREPVDARPPRRC